MGAGVCPRAHRPACVAVKFRDTPTRDSTDPMSPRRSHIILGLLNCYPACHALPRTTLHPRWWVNSPTSDQTADSAVGQAPSYNQRHRKCALGDSQDPAVPNPLPAPPCLAKECDLSGLAMAWTLGEVPTQRTITGGP